MLLGEPLKVFEKFSRLNGDRCTEVFGSVELFPVAAIDKPLEKGLLYKFKLENCTGCKKCAEECPCGFIDML